MKRIFSILFALVLAVSLMLVPAASVGASPGPGIVGLWHLDEGTGDNASDSSGNDNHGTIVGAVYAGSANSMFGDALSFDGNDYVNFGTSSLPQGNSSMTLEAWMRTTSVGPTAALVFGDPEVNKAIYISIYRGRPLFGIWGGCPNQWGYAGYDDGEWHHIAGVSELSEGRNLLKLYVDGVYVPTQIFEGVNPTYAQNIGSTICRVGADVQATPGQFFIGDIDEVRIWDVALTPTQIAESASLGEARNNDLYDTIVSHEAGSSVFIFTSAFHNVAASDNISFRLMRVDSTATINGTAGVNGISIRRVTPNPKSSTWPLDHVYNGDPADTERDIFPGVPDGPRHLTLHLDVNLTGGLEPLGFNLHTKGL